MNKPTLEDFIGLTLPEKIALGKKYTDFIKAQELNVLKDRYIAKIPLQDLIDEVWYLGTCRHATLAKWDATRQTFLHYRTKFGKTYLEEIKHPEQEDYYDVFVVERIALPEEVAEII